MNDRLLTKDERDRVYDTLSNDATRGEERMAFCVAQDAKTSRKIFEELEPCIVARFSSLEAGCFIVAICEEDWEALKGKWLRGEMPHD